MEYYPKMPDQDQDWTIYRFLARYHWLHHRYPDKNFNVVFPLADYVLGTRARANDVDLQCMHEQFDTQAPKALAI